jgi:hypothetical protein
LVGWKSVLINAKTRSPIAAVVQFSSKTNFFRHKKIVAVLLANVPHKIVEMSQLELAFCFMPGAKCPYTGPGLYWHPIVPYP